MQKFLVLLRPSHCRRHLSELVQREEMCFAFNLEIDHLGRLNTQSPSKQRFFQAFSVDSNRQHSADPLSLPLANITARLHELFSRALLSSFQTFVSAWRNFACNTTQMTELTDFYRVYALLQPRKDAQPLPSCHSAFWSRSSRGDFCRRSRSAASTPAPGELLSPQTPAEANMFSEPS